MKLARRTAATALLCAYSLLTLPALALADTDPETGETILKGEANGKDVTVRLPNPEKQLPLDELRKFTEVFGRIREAYVEEVDDTTLLENAIKGMLSGLDPHSAYLEPQAYEELEESTSGEFGGLGIEVGMEDGFVRVISPIDDTPAQKAGVQAGDMIIKLGDQPVKGMSLEEAVNLMRGKPGSTLKLTIVRDEQSAPIEIDVKRDVIKVASVKSRMLEPGYAYLRLTQFQAETGREFVEAIDKLEQDNGGKLSGLIIDLRNNPGGVLQAAVESADAVLDEGLIVYTDGRIQSSKLRFSAQPGDETDGAPIVVLINGGSASASEILAGALQDNHRAVIMGTESFGKGSVQTVIPLDETHAIKLTTARYYTPSGRSIQAKGIHPDIVVKQARLTEVDNQPFFTEADLSGHLENGTEDGKTDDKTAKAAKDELVAKDYQLRTALNLLKGLGILGKSKESAQ
ncbi:S41 family peptidase [Marinobacter sp. R17]|uniref:S41 family peptidase n=1 Tax=Marinobacter sp. R17 TaxID=2484250 RepID=UPI000F4B0B65|nr:S41 family peptidase [Marinobacter sp. R17]ROT98702.1 S41 family peptidase [Marinobacter sp. R17]